jgi:hypothetical protein
MLATVSLPAVRQAIIDRLSPTSNLLPSLWRQSLCRKNHISAKVEIGNVIEAQEY